MSANLTLELISKTAQDLLQLGITNSKQEIIWYLEQHKLLNLTNLYTNNVKLNNLIVEKINFFYNERKKFKPYQYIVNECQYYGRSFYVDSRVLIPRPETEILIDYIKNKFFNQCLEVGIGSGAISITLLLEKHVKNITATDISQDALKVAKINFKKFKLKNFKLMQHDFLNEKLNTTYDLIVSNPPYITKTEYLSLPKEIKNYEPKIALTDNQDGLLFYRRFAKTLKENLKPEGLFLCEISATIEKDRLIFLFKREGITANLIKDLNGKNRLLAASLNS